MFIYTLSSAWFVRVGTGFIRVRTRLIGIRVRLVRIRICLGRKLCHQRVFILHQQIVCVFAELIGFNTGLRLQPFERQIGFELIQFGSCLQKIVDGIQGNARTS